MLSQHSLEDAVREAGIEAPPVFLPEAGSTNTELSALAERGAPEWTVVAAGHQTAGRGRLGRTWTSAPGRSLTFSTLLRPRLAPEEVALVPLLAATQMVHACRELTGVEVASKWPNDLVGGERKLGGLLAESRIGGDRVELVVLGIGVNVSTRTEDFPAELRASATSLAAEGGSVEMEDLIGRFLSRLREAADFGNPDLPERLVSAYASVCATLGQRVRVRTLDGRTVEGTAAGLDSRGGLLVDVGGEMASVSFGEAAHLG